MLIVYDSKTGNVKRFISKLKLPAVQIDEQMTVDEPYVLVTYTTGFGQIPQRVAAFLQHNAKHLQGVSASGNRNWGERFALSADLISQQYQVPVISKFELSGTKTDVERFERGVSLVATY
ncbi:class Ib ribonucleoside-diphosphate reductase assembly flavoprotein NrdI [Paenibacillus tengchongensis]|uniref:class Ib ribonucleoside-diphosphate reductase assembly flavoprotein NrdI n=1 Tax=Paenibacillus tengchongensis TaxID=2608684 RepID=UPI00124F2410|nr:class Ib ribonucleoside-diphosphate reductase assembly flavoprotein NrdI [Paenibacillus tengchongensis]